MKYLVAIVAAGLLFAGIVNAQSPAQTIHDTYCIVCHDTQVYTRDSRLANDYATLRAQVDRWQSNIALNWSDAEIDMMAVWLAERYYGLNCPEDC